MAAGTSRRLAQLGWLLTRLELFGHPIMLNESMQTTEVDAALGFVQGEGPLCITKKFG